jgi:hypothetical protein
MKPRHMALTKTAGLMPSLNSEALPVNDFELGSEFLQSIRNLRIAGEMTSEDRRRFTSALALELQHWRRGFEGGDVLSEICDKEGE